MTPEQLQAIEKRRCAATPGPWGWYGVDNEDVVLFGGPPEERHIATFESTEDYQEAHDADFIAHAREDVQGLVYALEAEQMATRVNRRRLGECVQVLEDIAQWTSDPRARRVAWRQAAAIRGIYGLAETEVRG